LLPYLDEYWQHYMRSYHFDKGPSVPSPWPYAAMLPFNGRAEWELEDGSHGTELEALQQHLFTEEKVTTAILNGFLYPSAQVANFELATAVAKAYNDWEIHEWLDKEPRLRGSVQVIANDPDVAAEEIDRVGQHPQIVQVFLPLISDRQYGDPFYLPIFEAALRNDLVVTMHHSTASRTLLGYPRYWIEWHMFAAPHSAMAQLTSMIVNGLFDKLPELKVVLLETGVAWIPWYMGRADAQYRELRVEVPWVKRLPSEHMRDNVRVATQPMGDITPKNFLKMVEMAGSEDMFVFATDYPHFDADSADVVLGRLPEDLQRKIRYENAINTFPRLRGLADQEGAE
jgi:predicted TIM-barrel fold metal-dependent hydrolase